MTEKNQYGQVTVGAILRRVYRILHSKLVGVLIILAMAVLSLIGTLVMQAPVSRRTDPEGYARWLPNAQEKLGGWATIFDYLGFFNMWSSPLFLGVTVLLALSIIACTTHRLPELIKKTLHPRIHVSDRFFSNAQYRAVIPTERATEESLKLVRDALCSRRFRLVVDDQDPSRLYADRFRYGPFGTVIAHAAFVVILAAFGVSAFTGFETNLDIAIGEKAEVGNGTELSVEAVSFDDVYDPQGRPTDYVSHLIVRKGSEKVAEQDVRVNTPIVVDGVRFHQASFGVAAAITVTDDKGAEIVKKAVPLKWTSGDGMNVVGRLDLPDRGLEIIVATPASGQRTTNVGTATIEVYQVSSDKKIGAATVDQGTQAQVGPVKVTFEREQRFTAITVRNDPGTLWMWGGSVLLIIGMVMTFGFRHRRIWVRVTNDTIYVASVEQQDTLLDREFRQLVQDISQSSSVNKEGTHA
ncbi:membrane protein required for cytochrome C biosynthesis [Corynebacterium ulcerans 809]|uniref:cytochrome c biogenesis protein ResB n=1 Tax=Corynebacterium ulcerans TaxID=65058 RepID=UPI000218517B|nr:cytochrome c biogenesis protein ResB [Corynebacterium ulcerans]AEG82452.1 membrane protein required for cytochrome C biosynthesis [Corynebacterium ulcerans 809]